MSENYRREYIMDELACPKCGHKHILKKYGTVNVTEKKKMKEKILKNELFVFRCEECGLYAPLTYDSLYVDDKRKLMIYLAPVMTGEVQERLDSLGAVKGGTKRLVDNINDLKEKIMIADNHLDDRVIELLKIMVINQIKEEMKDDNLVDILFDYSPGNLWFILFFEKKGMGRIPLSLENYRQIERQYRMGILDFSRDDFMKVDLEWAGRIMFRPN